MEKFHMRVDFRQCIYQKQKHSHEPIHIHKSSRPMRQIRDEEPTGTDGDSLLRGLQFRQYATTIEFTRFCEGAPDANPRATISERVVVDQNRADGRYIGREGVLRATHEIFACGPASRAL